MPPHYRIDPGQSRFTVQAFAGGMLSFLAHSPTFAVRDFAGELRWPPDGSDGVSLVVSVAAASLELLDQVKPEHREEIEGRMRREVLEVEAYPEIRFEAVEMVSSPTGTQRYRLRCVGPLSLHGVRNRGQVDADLLVADDGVRLAGEMPLRMSDYRIRPVTALGGTIRLRDQLRIAFDIVAMKETT